MLLLVSAARILQCMILQHEAGQVIDMLYLS